MTGICPLNPRPAFKTYCQKLQRIPDYCHLHTFKHPLHKARPLEANSVHSWSRIAHLYWIQSSSCSYRAIVAAALDRKYPSLCNAARPRLVYSRVAKPPSLLYIRLPGWRSATGSDCLTYTSHGAILITTIILTYTLSLVIYPPLCYQPLRPQSTRYTFKEGYVAI